MAQRVRALEAFLADRRILREGVLPRRLITSCEPVRPASGPPCRRLRLASAARCGRRPRRTSPIRWSSSTLDVSVQLTRLT
ncbi:hypothetical protein BS329_06630 [Amycolatopsis coloradensis]|uniref:Uncharacterized protein n=1 Tax=Amycolatopsis coloradensis TaxID=76021 RepID=A0A1R0L1D9_9PSEU|nr:hypothetical protein BS329_06630 [Amycolatopsis coloradensis]